LREEFELYIWESVKTYLPPPYLRINLRIFFFGQYKSRRRPHPGESRELGDPPPTPGELPHPLALSVTPSSPCLTPTFTHFIYLDQSTDIELFPGSRASAAEINAATVFFWAALQAQRKGRFWRRSVGRGRWILLYVMEDVAHW